MARADSYQIISPASNVTAWLAPALSTIKRGQSSSTDLQKDRLLKLNTEFDINGWMEASDLVLVNFLTCPMFNIADITWVLNLSTWEVNHDPLV